jgi:alpha-glucoside transport system substrate-binding protein
MKRLNSLTILTAAMTASVALTACGGSTPTSSQAGADLKGKTLDVMGVWSGDEQKDFEAVLALFDQETGANVNYTAAGDDLPTVLQTKIDGKTPPNVAFLAQPGLIEQFANSGALQPLDPAVVQAIDAHYPPAWKQFGSANGVPYGVYFKAANKSTVWYNDKAFTQAGVTPPATLDDFDHVTQTLSDDGVTPISVGGADGWVLTDWFENIYLRTAGADLYDKLAKHQIPWTDPSVAKALTILRQVLTDQSLAGGVQGTLLTDFPTSVSNVFADKPKAAMVYEGDFVGGVITQSTSAKLGVDAKVFPFPSIGGSPPSVVTGGDAAVAFTDDSATTALMKFLASPEAAAVWAKKGGFISPNKDLPKDAYPDDLSRSIAQQVIDAGQNIRFDMSDSAPTAFGATKGAGEWKDLQDFLADSADITGAQAKLEADASKTYGKK